MGSQGSCEGYIFEEVPMCARGRPVWMVLPEACAHS